MQLPPVDRTVNGPSLGTDLQPAAGGSNTIPRASRAETAAIQQASAQGGPSVKLELSAELEQLIKAERARTKVDDQARAKSEPGVARADAKQQPGPADKLAADVAPSADKVDKPQKTDNPVVAAKNQAQGQPAGPDKASATDNAPSKDWTQKPKTQEAKAPEPPKEPISKMLLAFLQSLWRAGGNAIDVAESANPVLNPPRKDDGPLTYSDPSQSKKTTGV